MGDGSSDGIAFPDVFAAVRETLESQEGKVQRQAEDLKRQVDRNEAVMLLRLRKAVAILDPAYEEPAPSARSRRSRRRPAAGTKETPAVKAKKARESIYRYLLEAEKVVGSAELRGSLGLSEAVVRNALKRMAGEGLIAAVESPSGNGYVVAAETGSRPGERKGETDQGLILVTLEDRGWASPAELAQLLRTSVDKVEEEAAVLIVEEEIKWAQREGRKVYVLAGAE
jgi:predicted DNA-binding transcriptional regulator